jgi:hypothetical protein
LPNQGIDIHGDTTVGLKDDSLATSWDVIDTYNLTHLRDISLEQAGTQVDHVFADGNSPVHFPIHAGCTIKAPCYNSTEVPAALSQVALKNIGNAVAGRAKEEARKHAESALKKAVPAGIQNQFKRFF